MNRTLNLHSGFQREGQLRTFLVPVSDSLHNCYRCPMIPAKYAKIVDKTFKNVNANLDFAKKNKEYSTISTFLILIF